MHWQQKDDKLIVTAPEGEFYFIMPEDWQLKDIHPDLLKFTEIVLFGEFHPELYNQKLHRPQGKKIGLSFSGGVDSTVAMILLEQYNPILAYIYRDIDAPFNILKQNNALNFINQLDKPIYIVKSNHELIRMQHNFRVGYTCDWAVVAHLILLADYLDLGYIASGTILESTFLHKDKEKHIYFYRNLLKSDYWAKWQPLFKSCGLELLLPVGSLSEVITTKIINESKYKDLAKSCIQSDCGECGICFKCFRKNLLTDKKTILHEKTLKIIRDKPPKMLSSLMYGIKKAGLTIPELSEYMNLDVSFLVRYYPKALELLPTQFRNTIKTEIEKYCQPMTKQNIKSFEKIFIK